MRRYIRLYPLRAEFDGDEHWEVDAYGDRKTTFVVVQTHAEPVEWFEHVIDVNRHLIYLSSKGGCDAIDVSFKMFNGWGEWAEQFATVTLTHEQVPNFARMVADCVMLGREVRDMEWEAE